MSERQERYYWRKLRSPRGTVMLEFVLLASLLLTMGMFVIEILQYYDATLMADHTAWRIARMAKVRVAAAKNDTKDKSKKSKEKAEAEASLPKVLGFAKAEQVATVLLMSTATPGWGRMFDAEWKDKISGWDLGNKLGKVGMQKIGNGFSDFLISKLKIFDNIRMWIDKTLKNQRVLRGLTYASARVFLRKDILSIETKKFDTLLHPHISTKKNEEPKQMMAYVVEVKVDYPMRGGWLFKYLAGQGRDKSDPRAHGVAVMLAENKIPTERLKKGAGYCVEDNQSPGYFKILGGFFKKLFRKPDKKELSKQQMTADDWKKARELQQDELDKVRNDNKANFAEEEALQKKLKSQKERLGELNNLLNAEQDTRKALETQQNEVSRFKKELASLKQPDDATKIETVSASLKKAEAAVKKLEAQDFEAIRQERNELQKKIEDSQNRLTELSDRNIEARNKISELEKISKKSLEEEKNASKKKKPDKKKSKKKSRKRGKRK